MAIAVRKSEAQAAELHAEAAWLEEAVKFEAQAAELRAEAARLKATSLQCEALAQGSLEFLPSQFWVGQQELTTLMLRNLPNDYTRAMLLELLDSSDLAGEYDFAYLPIDFNRKTNLGYAFVNYVSQAAAELAMLRLHGFNEFRLTRVGVFSFCMDFHSRRNPPKCNF